MLLFSYFCHILIVFEESCLTCTAVLLLCLPSFLFHKAIALLITVSALLGFFSMTCRMRTWQKNLQDIQSPVSTSKPFSKIIQNLSESFISFNYNF
ncbi:putative integral membrane protein [Acanthocheilonema viteae]